MESKQDNPWFFLEKLGEISNQQIEDLHRQNSYKGFKKLYRTLSAGYIEPGQAQNRELVDILKKKTEYDILENERINESFNNKMSDLERKIYRIQNNSITEHQLNGTVDEKIDAYNTNLQVQLGWIQHQIDVLSGRFDFVENRIPQDFNLWNKKTYSQTGEDAIIMFIMRVLDIPFNDIRYLDLGANKPIEMSNTYAFYEQGAKGVLLEGNEDLISDLEKHRYHDTILNYAVTDKDDSEITFYVLNTDGLSSTDKEAVDTAMEKNKDIKIINTITMPTITVNTIIEKYMNDRAPEILSIDIEGAEMQIIESIDFDRYKPLIIIMEMITYDTKLAFKTKNQELFDKMISLGYSEYAFTGINSIFLRDDRI